MPSATTSVDASSVVAEFWAGIRQPELGPLVSSARERIVSVCPTIDTFSFDLINDEEAAAGTSRETPVASVEAGTPRPVVTAWNDNKLVGLAPRPRISKRVLYHWKGKLNAQWVLTLDHG
jgi:hypothetical protein